MTEPARRDLSNREFWLIGGAVMLAWLVLLAFIAWSAAA